MKSPAAQISQLPGSTCHDSGKKEEIFMSVIIAPSVLSLDYSETAQQLKELNATGAEWM